MASRKVSGKFWEACGDTHRQRMTTAEWRQILLDDEDQLITRGRLRRLKGTPIGAGVIEVSMVVSYPAGTN